MRSPILFLIFNRPDTTSKVFESIRKAQPPRLYVAADGPRIHKSGEAARCAEARALATAVDWNCEVHTLFRDTNLGCGNAVRSALDWFFEAEEEGVVLEDDILPHPTFYAYCDELLSKYRHDERVGTVSGSNLWNGRSLGSCSYSFSRHVSVWGWASWRRSWQRSKEFYAKVQQRDAELLGVAQLVTSSVDRNKEFENSLHSLYRGLDTWDYQWCLCNYANGSLVCRPKVNLTANIGFGDDATHTTGPAPDNYGETESMAFPIVHPAFVTPDLVADETLETWWLGPRVKVKTSPKLVDRFREAKYHLGQTLRRFLKSNQG